MANQDPEPPRLVRPYISGGGDTTEPAPHAPPPVAAAPTAGAHRPPDRPSPPPRPDGVRAGAGTGPGRRRALLIAAAAVAAVALIAGLAAVVLDRRDRVAPATAAPSALPLPAPPETGEASPVDTGPSASGSAPASSAARSPSRTGTPRRSATGAAPGAGTPAAANPDGANLALGRPATASSVEGDGYAPRFAVDGDPGTRWSSAFSDPQSITVDLGRLWQVTQVALRWEAAYGVEYDLEVSADGTTWRTVWRTGEGAGGVRDVRIAATAARFVRMTGTRRSGQYGYSLWEFEVR